MSSADSVRRRAAWKQRQAEWFAEHPCRECGSGDNLKTLWNGPKETQPLRSMTDTFRLGVVRREELLTNCYTLCYECWKLTLKRNGHGGGKTGIATCDCVPCVTVRRAYYNSQGRIQTERLRQRREKLIELGLPTKGVGWDNNWNNSEQGKAHKRHRRTQLKNEWLEGRECVTCGADDRQLVPVWKEYPGPLGSTSEIWAHGQPKRDELLEKCQTQCVSCSRYASEERRREKRNR
jgi:hypothetical protein